MYPSGALLATCAAPSVPPAPGLFSTMIGCPSARDIGSATVRAMMSVPLPAVKGTTKWIGLSGNPCAWAAVAAAIANAARIILVFMGSS